MKKLSIALCLATTFAVPTMAQDACSQTTKLTGGTTFTSNTSGNTNLSGSPYGYEMWTDGGNNNKLTWFGASQGGGAAFRAEWNNPNDFLGRIGYYWGDGGNYTQYKNIYADFNYTRSGRSTAGDYSYIGIYGWSRNSSASNANERLIEYYVVEDWFGNQWQADTGPMGTGTTGGSEIGTFTIDGATYKIIKNLRENKPSIDGTKTFTQIFSIRQTLRKCGTISVTEHFKKWESLGLTLGKMYESKFLVEAGGGTGWLEFSWLKLSQEDQPRGSGSTPSSSSIAASSSSKPSSSSIAASSSSRASSSSIAASSSSRASSSSIAASSSSRASSSSAAASSSSRASSSSAAASSSSHASSSSTAAGSSSSGASGTSSSSEEGISSSSEDDETPILNSQFSIPNSQLSYYSIKGEPLGNAKPQKAGVYIVKQGSSVKKIVVR